MSTMTADVAQAIASAAKAMPKKPTKADASYVIRAWLRAERMQVDRWGNYKRPGKDDERWQFGEKVFRHQYRDAKGEWINRDTGSMIDAAYDLIGQAAIVLEDPELSGRVLKETGKRKDVSETQRHRVATKEKVDLARELAMRALAATHRGEVLAWMTGQHPDPTKLKQLADVHYDRFLELLEAGADPADIDEGGQAASVREPPILPLRTSSEYFWVEQVQGRKYPINIWTGNRTAHVDIGWGAGAAGLGRTPSKIVTSLLTQRHGSAEARVQGEIGYGDAAKFRATLRLLANMPGADDFGSLVESIKQGIYLWCTILEGYDIRSFLTRGLLTSPPGQRAFGELVETGTIYRIAGSGDDYDEWHWKEIT